MSDASRAYRLNPGILMWRWVGTAAGVLLWVGGVFALIARPWGPNIWMLLPILAGPLVIVCTLVATSTYLEEVDEEDYFPNVYLDNTPRDMRRHAH